MSRIPVDQQLRVAKATPPQRPANVMQEVSRGLGMVASVPGKGIELLNTGFAVATDAIAQALPCFPAATLSSVAMGAPHAHIKHPPSGPPPVPPTPLPAIGPVLLGACLNVLIEGKPAARCGDIGLSPTCCGLPPMYEVFTGSSKVFIGGARAARQLDVTYHCRMNPQAAGCRAAATAARKAMEIAMKAMMAAGVAAQAAGIAGDAMEAASASDPEQAAAAAMSAALATAQMAADAAAMAAAALMGTDQPAVPPTGTPGAIMINTAPTVQIGGFPMPGWLNVLKGLAKLTKGKGKRGPLQRLVGLLDGG
jgi:uncharacterized Zn-binding protein involved in type VI secretion